MKKLIAIVLLIAISMNCADEKKNTASVDHKIKKDQKESFMTAKVSGNDFYSEDLHYFSAQNIITLAAVSKDKTEKIRIYVNYNKGPTTYTFGKGISNSDNMVYTKDKVDWLAAKTKGKGTIVFTEEGGYLIAIFSFIGVNKEAKKTLQITEGKFRVLKK